MSLLRRVSRAGLMGIATAAAAAAVALASLGAPPVAAQPDPAAGDQAPAGESAGERAQAVADAFRAVGDNAGAGAWQGADAAFNSALDAMDIHRPALEAELGEPAVAAFQRVDELILELVGALDTEDLARLRVAVTLIEQEIVGIAPGAPAAQSSGGAGAAQAVIQWRSAHDAIMALAESGLWRDMRNAAMALIDDIGERGPDLVQEAGPGAQFDVDVARVFAMRLRAAALDQSLADARVAASVFSDALDGLERRTGLAPTQRPPSDHGSMLRFRAFEVRADGPGAVVTMPIVAEDIPQIGLGAMELAARWSPAALRLVDVTWDVADGSISRDDAGGQVELTLPAAPTGPSGDAVIGQLVFEVLDQGVSGEDYLPADEVERIETARSEAQTLSRQGDTPRAAAALAYPFQSLLAGAGETGSLHSALDEHGLADPLARSMLAALDATSRPAETDVITIALAELGRVTEATWDSYLAALAKPGGVPVVLEAKSATDTTGAPIPVAEALPGQVLLPEAPTSAAGDEPPSREPTVPPELVEAAESGEGVAPAIMTPGSGGALSDEALVAGSDPATSTARIGESEPSNEPGTDGPSGPTFPLPLVVALGLAAVLGAAAVLLADRGGSEEPDS